MRLNKYILKTKAKMYLAFCISVAFFLSGASSANIQQPNVVKDLHYGEVLFHFYQEDYFTSIVHLLAARELHRTENHAPYDELLLGGIDLSYGLQNEASRIFNKLLKGDVRDTVKNRAYYFLAKLYFQRGYLDDAEKYIKEISGPVQQSVFNDLKLLTGQVYISQGKYDDAIASLNKWKGPKNFRHYANYNLGIAHTKDGNIDQGIEYLKKVGKVKAKSESFRTLRDRANLASGLTLIQNDRPKEAVKYLNKVRLQGIYSNLALLGMGWANTEADKYNDALAPLMELRNRSAYHAEVQEGILALAHAYSELGLSGRAVEAYETAANIYQEEAQQLSSAASAIERGVLVDALLERTKGGPQMGWFWSMRELPEMSEVKYFTELLAEHEFHEAVKSFRDLLFLINNLKYWDENISIYLTMLDTRKARYQKYLPLVERRLENLDINELQAQRDKLSFMLDKIEQDNDFVKLATAEEKRKLSKIVDLSKKLEILENQHSEAAKNYQKIKEMREKIALMQGVMKWQIHSEFIQRKWDQKQDINSINHNLSTTPEKSLAVKQAIGESVKNFDQFETRIIALQKEIKRLIPIAERTFARQSKYLEYVAVNELKRREEILAGYEKHARFALAAAYDKAASAPAGQIVVPPE